MERGVYFDGWYKHNHCYHPSLPLRIRQMLESSSVLPDGKSITASFGVAQYQPGEDYGAFYRRLDALLYQAKDGGRNRVEWELG